jgi:carbonic anhydrase
MRKLYKGIHKFQEAYFKKEEEFFKRLSKEQEPEVLFITCADSRVDPNLVTQSRPGELFIVRNVGNIIPPYDAIKDKNSVAAAIEFAVLGLKVKDIIVCGHSNCGAMEALYKDERELTNMPHLKDWLKLAAPVKDIVLKYYSMIQSEARQRITEEENVLCQLHNIQTYPFVQEALNAGVLHLHGWDYNIETGKIYAYDTDADMFKEIRLSKTLDKGFKGAE